MAKSTITATAQASSLGVIIILMELFHLTAKKMDKMHFVRTSYFGYIH